MVDMYLLIWQAATSDGAKAPGIDQAMIAAVLFLLVKELLNFIGKLVPGVTNLGSNGNNRYVGGQTIEYWQEIIASRTAQAMRNEIKPVVDRLDAIALGVADLVRTDEDRRLGRARTRSDDGG